MKTHCVSVHPMPPAQAEKLASLFEVHVLSGDAAKTRRFDETTELKRRTSAGMGTLGMVTSCGR